MSSNRIIIVLCMAYFCATNAQGQTANETVLLNFGIFPGGASPYGTLARDSAGDLFGTSYLGGTANLGTVYEYSAAGKFTVLHSFQGGIADGTQPTSGVALDSKGNLYGTTYAAGAYGLGVVYKVTPSGEEIVLHSFAGGSDGSGPQSGVTLDAQGNIYGTTYYGGSSGAGVVYKITADTVESVLYTFTGGADGSNPYSGVTLDASNKLYGTTWGGGADHGGVVYTLSSTGQETVLFSFWAPAGCGVGPQGTPIVDTEGNLYGASNVVVYKLSAAGVCTPLANVVGATKYGGDLAPAAVAMDPDGNIYVATDVVTDGFKSHSPNGAILKVAAGGELTVHLFFSRRLPAQWHGRSAWFRRYT